MSDERSEWQGVADLMQERLGDRRVRLGRHLAATFTEDPRALLSLLTHYKFAAKLIGRTKRVLDIGCGEGLGTWVLAVECGFARGVDPDQAAIDVARSNWERDSRIEFDRGDPTAGVPRPFDAVTALHKSPRIDRLGPVLAHDGIAVVRTVGRVDELGTRMSECFEHVFMFGATEEVIHPGTHEGADYLIAVGCRPRSSWTETAS